MELTYIIYALCAAGAAVGAGLLKKSSERLILRIGGISRAGAAEKRKKLEERAGELRFLKKRRQERIDREICEGISYLRNMIAIERGREMSADYVITSLCTQKGTLTPVYQEMLSLLRVNRKQEAMDRFSAAADTAIGREFAVLLLQWDELPPAELAEVLLSHQKNIKEVQLTLQKRRDETISDLIYLPVVLNIFVIFINFIYVSYFIEQKEMFQMLF